MKVTIANMEFTPAVATVRAGDTIEWTNRDVVDHTATASNRAWDVSIAAGKTGRAMVTATGRVDYYCKFHPNMRGEVTAQELRTLHGMVTELAQGRGNQDFGHINSSFSATVWSALGRKLLA